jgi:Ser/Thr protein kinase RdoA (MazF antagonist)
MTSRNPSPRTLTIPRSESTRLLREHYGIEAVGLTPLHSELSTVVGVDLADGTRRVFRASASSPRELVLAHWRIGAADRLDDSGIPTGRSVPALSGEKVVEAETSDGPAALHVGEWLDGFMLSAALPTPFLMRAVGEAAARVSAGLADWPAPPAEVAHPWELLRTVETIQATVHSVTDPAARRLVDEALARFTATVEPRLADLPHQVVHHDLHDSNILVDTASERVTGVLDFGDMVWGPRIADLAIPGTHGARSSLDPTSAFIEVAEGWGRVSALEPEEIDLVFTAGLGRLAVTLSVWTDRANTERAEYARARSARTAKTLRRLLAADEATVRAELHRRLGRR